VCSLALFCGAADEPLIAHALDLVPKPDMLIQLEAPANILTNRLCNRQRLQSLFERMLEIDPKTTIEANQIFDQLRDLFRKRGQAVISVSSSDPHSLAQAANRIAEIITADSRSLHQTCRVVTASLSSEECQHV
jgi:thymidylate kinase